MGRTKKKIRELEDKVDQLYEWIGWHEETVHGIKIPKHTSKPEDE